MNRRQVMITLFFIVLYLIFDNGRRVIENPYIPGAIIEIPIIVPVIAGIIHGWRTGALVGFFGVLISWRIPIYIVYRIVLYEAYVELAKIYDPKTFLHLRKLFKK